MPGDGDRTGVRVLYQREHELDQLLTEARNARADRSGLVVVEGAAGTGKTALAESFAHGPASHRSIVLLARGGEPDNSYGVARKLFGPLLDPPLQDVWSRRGETAALHRLRRLTTRLASHRPLVLVVDDAHLADAASLRWLHDVVKDPQSGPLLLVLLRDAVTAAWHDAARPILSRISALPGGLLVEPALFTTKTVGDVLAAAMLVEPPWELVESCHQLTGGVPLLVRTVADALAANPLRPDPNAELPWHCVQAFTSVLLRVLDRLPEHTRLVGRALAVLGECADPAALGTLSGLDPASARSALHWLRRLGLVGHTDPIRWNHELLRDVVLDATPDHARASLHLANALDLHRSGAAVELVVDQLRHTTTAARPWVVELLRDKRSGAGVDRAPVRAALGVAAALDHPAAGIRLMRESLDELTDPVVKSDVAAALGKALARDGRSATAVENLHLVADQLDDPVMAAELRACEWVLAARDVPELCPPAEVVEDLLHRVPEETPGGRAMSVAAGFAGVLFGAEAKAVQAFITPEVTAVHLDPDTPLLDAAVTTLTALDEYALAASLCDQAITEARRAHNPHAVSTSLAARAHAAHAAGELDRAAMFARAACDVLTEAPAGVEPAGPIGALCSVLVDIGDPRAALDLAAAQVAETGAFTGAVLAVAQGRALLAVGDNAAAADHLLACGRRALAVGYESPVLVPWRPLAAHALARSGRRGEAAELADEALRRAHVWGTPRALGIALRAVAAVRPLGEGVGVLKRAVSVMRWSPAVLDQCRILRDLAEHQTAAGDLPQARVTLRHSLEIADRCGAHGLATQTRIRLREIGGHQPRRPSTGAGSLSRLERLVAERAATGRANSAIAAELHQSLPAVEGTLANVYRKLGITGQPELDRALGRRGAQRDRITGGPARSGTPSSPHRPARSP